MTCIILERLIQTSSLDANTAIKFICRLRLWACTHVCYGWEALGPACEIFLYESWWQQEVRSCSFRNLVFLQFQVSTSICVYWGVSLLPKKRKKKEKTCQKVAVLVRYEQLAEKLVEKVERHSTLFWKHSLEISTCTVAFHKINMWDYSSPTLKRTNSF